MIWETRQEKRDEGVNWGYKKSYTKRKLRQNRKYHHTAWRMISTGNR
jgi:hypothetical protein